jgi:hypothetical protein
VGDFADDVTTTGTYQLASAPLEIRSDFLDDGDWILVDPFKQHYSYRFFKYTNQTASNREFSVRDLSGDVVFNASAGAANLPFSVDYRHDQASGAMFVSFLSSPRSESEAATGEFLFYARTFDEAPNVINSDVPTLDLTRGYASGALERFGDVDFYRAVLNAGTRYVFDLHGAASYAARNTLLTDPILRIHGTDGKFIVGDNNSGTRSNARLVFTPAVTSTYFIKILGDNNTAGSYVLESAQLDDWSATTETQARVQVGGSPVTMKLDYVGDVDWARVSLVKGKSYRVTGTNSYSFYDRSGNKLRRDFFEFQPDRTDDYFVSVRGNNSTGITQLGIEENLNWQGVFPHPAVDARIGGEVTSNVWETELVSNASYYVEAVATGEDPLTSAQISVQSSDIYDNEAHLFPSLVFNFELGIGKVFKNEQNLLFTDVPYPMDTYFIRVNENAGDPEGTYQLRFTQVDVAGPDVTTQAESSDWISSNFDPSSSRYKEINSAIDTPNDIDVHRIGLEADRFYLLNGVGIRSLESISPTGNISSASQLESDRARMGYYYSTEAGDHFVRVDSDDLATGESTGGYTANAQELTTVPIGNSGHFSPQSLQTPSLDSATDFAINGDVEVYSNIPLSYDGGTIEPNQYAVLDYVQWRSLIPTSGFVGHSDVYARQKFENSAATNWSRVAVAGQLDPAIIAPNEVVESLSFAFADGLPSYFVNDSRFANFQPLSSGERNSVSVAMRLWSSSSRGHANFRAADNGVGNDEAQVMVFKADLNSNVPFLAFPNGDTEGGDIILNTNSQAMTNLAAGTEGFFEVLRAVGISLGLKETTQLGRDQTVMGRRSGSDVDDLPYPVTPLPLDYQAAREQDDFSADGGFGRQLNLVSSANSYLRIAGPQNLHKDAFVTAESSAVPWVIDLRPGGKSYGIVEDSELSYTVLNSYLHLYRDAIGSEGNDTLIGNQKSNVLYGMSGDDFFDGSTGNDIYWGGEGDDTFVVRPGQALVEITDATNSENAGAGTDQLNLIGLKGFDSLEEDLSFKLLENDVLNIELTLDSVDGNESINLYDMNSSANRIETLRLANTDGEFARISLQSVFSQATGDAQRFTFTAESDNFGRLVTPV